MPKSRRRTPPTSPVALIILVLLVIFAVYRLWPRGGQPPLDPKSDDPKSDDTVTDDTGRSAWPPTTRLGGRIPPEPRPGR